MLTECKTAIILAGGQSKRMGFDKIHIPYKEAHLLDYQIKQLKKLFSEIIIVSNQLTHYDDEKVKVVADEYKEVGPLAGLHVGLKHASHPYCYVIACDMSFINIDYIELMDTLLNNFSKDVIVSRVNGNIEPFNAIYHKTIYKEIEKLIFTNKKRSLQSLIKEVDVHVIDEHIVGLFGNGMFHNLNTVDDIKKYLEIEVI